MREIGDFPGGNGTTEVIAEMGWAAVLGRLPANPVLEHLQMHDGPHILMLRELVQLNILGEDGFILPGTQPGNIVRRGKTIQEVEGK